MFFVKKLDRVSATLGKGGIHKWAGTKKKNTSAGRKQRTIKDRVNKSKN